MKAWVVLVGLTVAGVFAASWAFSSGPPVMSGIPFAKETITVSTGAVGITNTLCRVGGVAGGAETKALVQIATAGVYFLLHSSTATPNSADYSAATGDWIAVRVPSRLRMVRSGGSDGAAIVTCFTQ